jgi:SAM-dependent methyltransferase
MGTAADRWDRFAREDPFFFIEADPAKRGSLTEFEAAGREMAEWALQVAGPEVQRGRVLEIGCGMARTARALAEQFERVDGIDIAPTMIERARDAGLPANLHLEVTRGDGGLDFGDGEFDFVFSHLVLQHVPDEAVVARYLTETARVLRPGGRALLQFDTRPPRLASRLLHTLPDALLPRRYRRHMRRVRRRPERLGQLVAHAGLIPARELGRGTADHWMLLAKRDSPSGE